MPTFYADKYGLIHWTLAAFEMFILSYARNIYYILVYLFSRHNQHVHWSVHEYIVGPLTKFHKVHRISRLFSPWLLLLLLLFFRFFVFAARGECPDPVGRTAALLVLSRARCLAMKCHGASRATNVLPCLATPHHTTPQQTKHCIATLVRAAQLSSAQFSSAQLS